MYFISVPLSGISSAVLGRELTVALSITLEPLAGVFRPVTIPVLADTVPFTVHNLALEDLATRLRTVVIIMARRRIGDLEVAVDPQHVKMVIDRHSFEGQTCAGRTVS